MSQATPRQIEHIKQHLGLFQDHQCHLPPYGNSASGVDEYFHDMAHLPDLYLNLCNDLDLEPLSAEAP